MGMSPPEPANVHSLGTLKSATEPFPMDQDRRRRPTYRGGRVSFSRDDTHRRGGAGLDSDGTVISEWLLRRSGGFQPGHRR